MHKTVKAREHNAEDTPENLSRSSVWPKKGLAASKQAQKQAGPEARGQAPKLRPQEQLEVTEGFKRATTMCLNRWEEGKMEAWRQRGRLLHESRWQAAVTVSKEDSKGKELSEEHLESRHRMRLSLEVTTGGSRLQDDV